MNGYDYRLKEKQANGVDSIASCIDDLRSELSAKNTKRIENELAEISCSIQTLTSSVIILNKTMEDMAGSLRAIAINTK
jgi:hypothetical protein